MRIHDQLKFSVRGFSLNRFTYCLDAVSMLLLLFYPLADTYFGNQKIIGLAFVLTIVVLLLCLLTKGLERTGAQRSVLSNPWLNPPGEVSEVVSPSCLLLLVSVPDATRAARTHRHRCSAPLRRWRA